MVDAYENPNEVRYEHIAKYIRVSTDDQNPDTHRNEVNSFVDREYAEANTTEYADIRTGTTTLGREQFLELKKRVSNGEFDAVVTTSVSRVARSIRDLSDFVEECEQHGTAVHFTREGLDFDPEAQDPYQRALLQMLGVFAELEAKITQQRTKEAIRQMRANGHKWGRAPFGFEKESGNIYPNEDHDRICSVLQLVDSDDLSQSKAAHMLETSRETIRRIIHNNERRELYGLSPT